MLSQRLKTAIEAHAADVYPNECCGLITRVGRGLYPPVPADLAEQPVWHRMVRYGLAYAKCDSGAKGSGYCGCHGGGG